MAVARATQRLARCASGLLHPDDSTKKRCPLIWIPRIAGPRSGYPHSGEARISNFLLWAIGLCEYEFIDRFARLYQGREFGSPLRGLRAIRDRRFWRCVLLIARRRNHYDDTFIRAWFRPYGARWSALADDRRRFGGHLSGRAGFTSVALICGVDAWELVAVDPSNRGCADGRWAIGGAARLRRSICPWDLPCQSCSRQRLVGFGQLEKHRTIFMCFTR